MNGNMLADVPYILCGVLDAVWQITSYWIMGAMSNDPAKLAYYSGFCELSYIVTVFSSHPS